MRIWKYPIGTAVTTRDIIEVDMPEGARIVHAQAQNEIPCVWAEVDRTNAPETRRFLIVATGEPTPHSGQYIGTVLQYGGTYVWHIYEVSAYYD